MFDICSIISIKIKTSAENGESPVLKIYVNIIKIVYPNNIAVLISFFILNEYIKLLIDELFMNILLYNYFFKVINILCV